MVKLNKYVTNINKVLKDIKSNIVADFIYVDNRDMVITTNKVATNLDLNIIEKYIKNIDKVDTSKVMSLRLLQSKSYLKILSIPCYVKDTNLPITLDIDTTYISDSETLERIIQELMTFLENLWNKYSKYVNITKYSKSLWNKECSRILNMYCLSKSSLDWKTFKGTVKRTKRSFFNKKIQEIASRNK